VGVIAKGFYLLFNSIALRTLPLSTHNIFSYIHFHITCYLFGTATVILLICHSCIEYTFSG